MDQKSVVSNRTRSRFSSAPSKALAVRAELEMAKAGLLFVERENKLREAKAKMESEEKTLEAQREIALKEAALKAFEEYVSLSEEKSSIHLDQTPADPMQRTREYVAEQTAQLNSQPAAPQLVQSSALQHTRSPASQFDQPTNSEASSSYSPDPPDPSDDHRRRCSTENRHDHSSDLTRYFARRELLQASMLKFSDRPKDYRAWRRSFRNSIVDLHLTPSEEMDLLVKWLGPASTEHANRLRTAYLNHPEKGLQEIWKRLEKCYGSPEAIEDSLFERIHWFPKGNQGLRQTEGVKRPPHRTPSS
ncbi:unnamed protein product [Acanthosepion pharaonis]|uniref:Uncharacterized protein n=1 Tax=Acanthosepion pharaonis TaxID=158019 RepID=A0A812BAP0_ACAPH|nr:unnamed protein product [Sepia pharaonis]